MIIAGYQDEQKRNCISLKLSFEESEAWRNGEPVKTSMRVSGDCHGHFTVTAKLTRPQSKAKRFRGL